MSGQSLALASLTATYTDSEAEDEGGDEANSPDSSVRSNISTTPPPPAQTQVPRPPPPPAIVSSKVAQLVSYHDDTLVSDEEGGEGPALRRSLGAEEEAPAATPMEVAAVEDGVKLFPEPPGRCSNELQEKINRLHEKMLSSGLDMNHVIQQRKDFRNPSIYEKLIQFCSINELGTNYPADQYDPLRWGKESFYEELARVQKVEMERREKDRKDRMRVEYVSGTAKRPPGAGAPGGAVGGGGGAAEDDKMRRKSKWDQVGTLLASNVTGTGAQAGILKPGLVQQPALTTTATGTKGTIISAFGSLPKKPRV